MPCLSWEACFPSVIYKVFIKKQYLNLNGEFLVTFSILAQLNVFLEIHFNSNRRMLLNEVFQVCVMAVQSDLLSNGSLQPQKFRI